MLSDSVKKLRKSKGWSQQKLAEKAGLSFNTVSKIEQGFAKQPTMQTLIKLADALGITLDRLVGRKKGMN